MSEGRIAFSRPFRVDQLGFEPLDVALSASTAERTTIASRLGVEAVDALAADFRLAKGEAGWVRVQGEVRADLTRICVVTLEPFTESVSEPIAVDFAPPSAVAAALAALPHSRSRGETVMDLPDPPDPIIDGAIDLGALATEFLALGLSPYPRKPGVAFEPPSGDGETSAGPAESPFAALARLKRDGV